MSSANTHIMGFTYKGYEAVIGLEVHVQLDTASKIFSSDQNDYGGEPNTHVHPVTLALPGTLPVANKNALQKAALLSMAIDAEINKVSRFDRKHYNYPDLPKGYQITQNFLPVCIGGSLTLSMDTERIIRFHHVHMEEDAGKSIHEDKPYSLIDLNRAGVPLLEMVTEPDLRSGEEVYHFIQELQRLVRWLGISNADMEKGELRCDCNVSVRKVGDPTLGERCEIKNLNSKKFARDAVEIEARNQVEKILLGEAIFKSTLHYDPKTKKTTGTRDKENEKDYRYFPDPDLPPVVLTEQELVEIKANLPILPPVREKWLIDKHGLKTHQAKQLCGDIETVTYYLQLAQTCTLYPQLANLIINQVLPIQKDNNIDLTSFPATDDQITSLLHAIDKGTISHNAGIKQVWPILTSGSNKSITQIIDDLGLSQQGEGPDIEAIIADALQGCQDEIEKYKGGKKALFGFFMGEVMKKSKGKLSPKDIKSGLTAYLSKL